MTQPTWFADVLSVAEEVPGRWLVSRNADGHKPFQNWANVIRFLARNQSLNRDSADVLLRTLGPGAYKLQRPIAARIDHISDDEVIASFPEAELSICGNTATEAIQLLKTEITETYEILKKEPKLGPVPQRQLKILGRYLGKMGREQTA